MERRTCLTGVVAGIITWMTKTVGAQIETTELPPLTPTDDGKFYTEWVVEMPERVEFAWGPTTTGRMFGILGGPPARTLYFQTNVPVRLVGGAPFRFEARG